MNKNNNNMYVNMTNTPNIQNLNMYVNMTNTPNLNKKQQKEFYGAFSIGAAVRHSCKCGNTKCVAVT
jgi:hypothetical protein